ncbi:MAG: NADH-quinone oxidoreductase subunit M [Actinomycetes bacterium]
MTLSILIAIPFAAGLLGLPFGGRQAKAVSLVGSLATLIIAGTLAVRYDTALGGAQFTVDKLWIEPIGVHWALAIDGLNLALVALTAFVYFCVVVACLFRDDERPGQFFFHLGFAASAVLGAFLAQDLLLFVLFFDLMLIPFYFLVGQWGDGERIKATTKMVIYTLSGSLLMFAAAAAAGALTASQYGMPVNFLISNLQNHALDHSTQHWVFVCFALAFLVKMPAVPLHGWLRDAYRAMPLPALALFSGVLSKVAAYGFLKLAVPLFPDGAADARTVLLIVALASILYGSALAFTTSDARLVVGYSSIAQLGFILLGIFSLTEAGAQGALMQMVNHGVVTVLLVAIVGMLAARAKGSEDLGSMGAIAMGAPVMAVVFLIAALANLAMPASANFIGEFLILRGTWDSASVFAVLACIGVVMAAVYMLRMYIRSMHGPDENDVEKREMSWREAATVVPAVIVVLALALYPQALLSRSEGATTASILDAANGAMVNPIAPEARK